MPKPYPREFRDDVVRVARDRDPGVTVEQIARDFGGHPMTLFNLLATHARDLRQVLRTAAREWYLILDGTLIRMDRVAEDRPYYSGKHKRHGVNVQILADPRGRLLWASPALPGSTHDLTAARTHGVIDALADLDVWA